MRIFLITMTASEASRRFSAVLEAGQSEGIRMTKGGLRDEAITSALTANGAALLELAETWSAPDDPEFERDITEVRKAGSGEDVDPWASN